MPFLGNIFHDYLDGPWEVARGYLREELDQLYVALRSRLDGEVAASGDRITNSSGQTPSGLTQGSMWLEYSGVSPNRIYTIMVRDNNVNKAIFTFVD